jgi:hypothetical protein
MRLRWVWWIVNRGSCGLFLRVGFNLVLTGRGFLRLIKCSFCGCMVFSSELGPEAEREGMFGERLRGSNLARPLES